MAFSGHTRLYAKSEARNQNREIRQRRCQTNNEESPFGKYQRIAGGRSKIVRRKRSVASQPYRLFRSVPRRPSSSNLANLVARKTILAKARTGIHTSNLVRAPLMLCSNARE